ncbi:MAG: hypothetical protein JWM62_2462 [Frankiales bacterium]|jgi:uncharacterized damage-inducible protein DinB|nr:hypothetical protein [Frankiales bacterium]
MSDDPKAVLHHYLRQGREALLWKLDGLSEYDVRRPMTPTGTNLLGLVKHVASVEAGYLGDCFGRPFPVPLPWMAEDAEPNADMWVPASESRASVLELHHAAAAHADATIDALPLEAPGHVPWWRLRSQDVTLQQVLVHVVAETHRHAGHADLVRELVDGAAGLRVEATNLPDDLDWAAYRERLEDSARTAEG